MRTNRSRRRRSASVLAGGYRLRLADAAPQVTIVAMGVSVVEAIEAAELLAADGIAVDVLCLTSADLVFRAAQARRGIGEGDDAILDELFAPERRAPIVSVLDGHPHTLAFLGTITDTPQTCLGVQDFGQTGDVDDLYRHFGIDADTVVGAALDLIG